jgi:hypothetical protein
MLPIQANLRPSSCASPRSGSTGMLRDTVASTLPSLGATLATYWAARMLPAPGMFCGIMLGLPGM